MIRKRMLLLDKKKATDDDRELLNKKVSEGETDGRTQHYRYDETICTE